MNCPGTQTLADWAFSKASGDTPPAEAAALAGHLTACPECSARYAQWLRIARTGRAVAAESAVAAPCPGENTLAEYVDGVLASDARDQVERHLAQCGPCVRQLCELHSILMEVNQQVPLRRVALEWLRQGIRVLEATADSMRPVALATAPVLRGSHTPDALCWETFEDGFTLKLTVQRTTSGTLTLHIALRQGEAQAPGYQIALRAAGALLESRATDGAGMAEFFGLAPDEYTVDVTLPGGPLTVAVSFPA